MSNARKRRRYLAWCRYDIRCKLSAGFRGPDEDGDYWIASLAPWGLARAGASQYRNGAKYPYGWQPRQPQPPAAGVTAYLREAREVVDNLRSSP